MGTLELFLVSCETLMDKITFLSYKSVLLVCRVLGFILLSFKVKVIVISSRYQTGSVLD